VSFSVELDSAKLGEPNGTSRGFREQNGSECQDGWSVRNRCEPRKKPSDLRPGDVECGPAEMARN